MRCSIKKTESQTLSLYAKTFSLAAPMMSTYVTQSLSQAALLDGLVLWNYYSAKMPAAQREREFTGDLTKHIT